MEMKDKLKTLKQQIDKYITDLEELFPKAIDAGDHVELGVMRGEQIALEWVLERMKENAGIKD
jgi:hypothetical protein